MEAFPVLFGIARANDAFVAAHLEFYGDSNQWNVSFARVTQDFFAFFFFFFFSQVLY